MPNYLLFRHLIISCFHIQLYSLAFTDTVCNLCFRSASPVTASPSGVVQGGKSGQQYYLQVMVQMPGGETVPVQIPAALAGANANAGAPLATGTFSSAPSPGPPTPGSTQSSQPPTPAISFASVASPPSRPESQVSSPIIQGQVSVANPPAPSLAKQVNIFKGEAPFTINGKLYTSMSLCLYST